MDATNGKGKGSNGHHANGHSDEGHADGDVNGHVNGAANGTAHGSANGHNEDGEKKANRFIPVLEYVPFYLTLFFRSPFALFVPLCPSLSFCSFCSFLLSFALFCHLFSFFLYL